MEFYRIKHKPTGLYYKPGKHNLSKKGKVYTGGGNILTLYKDSDTIPVAVKEPGYYDQFYPGLRVRNTELYYMPKTDFVIEPINV